MRRQYTLGTMSWILVLGMIALAARHHLRDARPPTTPPETSNTVMTGRVEHVFDGDTIKLAADGRQWRVRLKGIDAPEWKQDYGDAAREYLVDLCDGKWVRVDVAGRDPYDRILGNVYTGDTWINALMVKSGYAWAWSRNDQAAELVRLEHQARTSRRGLWADPQQIPPWAFRKKQRTESGPAR